MKKINYLDFIATILPEGELESFKERYQKRINKSIKIIWNQDKKSDFWSYFSSVGRELKAPAISKAGKYYDDVLYVEKDDKESLGSHFLHQSGYFYVQEVAAGLSAQVLDVKKWDLVLDLCAAPWGKSIQIADKLLQKGAGFILSNEPSDPRRKALIFNLNRCGMLNSGVCAYRGEQIGELSPEVFDKVLVDAPCSGEGMNYKHDKNTNYRDSKLAQDFSKLQYQILRSGLIAAKVWGEIVYSTCTLNPLENEQVISRILKDFEGAVELINIEIDQKSSGLTSYWSQDLLKREETEKLARFWPHKQKTGGFFIAKMRKTASIPYSQQIDKRKKEKNWLNTSIDLQNQVWEYLFKHREIEEQEGLKFLASESCIYISTDEFEQLPSGLFIEKIWVPILKIWNQGNRVPQQGLARVLGKYAHKNSFDITDEQAEKLNQKSDLFWFFGSEGEFVILKWRDLGFTLGKQVGEMLKNKLF